MNNRVGDNLIHFGANEELVRTMTSFGIKFVIVGGLAIAWHRPERLADDMDLLIAPTKENSARVSRALASLRIGGHSAESFTKLGLQIPIKDTFYAELVTPKAGTASFDEIEADAVDAKLFGIPVRLASVSTLIAMKIQAIAAADEQREKHLKDVALLETPAP